MTKKREDALNQSITEINEVIQELKKLLGTIDVCLLSKYQSRNCEFSNLPAEIKITLPTFKAHEMNRNLIDQQFGSLSKQPITYQFLNEPRILTDIQTKGRVNNKLLCVSCLTDSEMWTCFQDKNIKLYNLQGNLLKSVQTKSGNSPYDIAVTIRRDLLYSDNGNCSVTLVSDKNTTLLIKLSEWQPLGVCCTSSGDILVAMQITDNSQSKVMRYTADVTEKQCIQLDDQGEPLFSPDGNKYLIENRNYDICVSDDEAHAVVVVSSAGKLRFRYTGPASSLINSFRPVGITTDSIYNILTADNTNHCIHILDCDGHFLRYIDNCSLHTPWGLCVDSKDHLLVAELDARKLKKIKYYK